MKKLKNEELNRLTVEEYTLSEKLLCVIILDDVRSAMNVGSAFRTADAFAIAEIYLCGITATPPHREINKTALGAQDTVRWHHEENALACVEKLKANDYQIIAVEQADESTSLLDLQADVDKKYAFVFGNEVFGVKDEIVLAADTVLEIPQYGTKHSLNISVSMGVVLWDYLKQIKKPS